MTQITPIMINDVDQLRQFSASSEFHGRRPVILHIPGIPSSEALIASEQLNKDRAACGCSLAAQSMTAVFTIALTVVMLHFGVFSWDTLIRVPIALILAFLAAAAGKVIGTLAGHRRARRQIQLIQIQCQRRWSPEP